MSVWKSIDDRQRYGYGKTKLSNFNSELLGLNVETFDGEKLGEVETSGGFNEGSGDVEIRVSGDKDLSGKNLRAVFRCKDYEPVGVIRLVAS